MARIFVWLAAISVTVTGCFGEGGLINPGNNPDGVLGAMRIPGGILRDGRPPSSSGSGAPSVGSTGDGAMLIAGEPSTVDVPFSGSNPYESCIVTVAGADGYIEVPASSDSMRVAEGVARLSITVNSSVASGPFTCVYGVTDSSGGVSNYVETPVTFMNPDDSGSDDGDDSDPGGGPRGTCSESQSCGGGGSFRACTDGSGDCWYEYGGRTYDCSGCDCTSAAQALANDCAG